MDLTATAGRVLDPARDRDPARYAIEGRTPEAALRPATREEVAEVVRWAAVAQRAVVPWGAGVGLARAAGPARYDLALDVTALDRVVAYEPEDLTLTIECGATLAAVRAMLGARGQVLPLEGAGGDRATLGGVFAANASGSRRRAWGAPRDRILGARFVTGDGTLARTGGRVVKNVAGYAVHRLLCGARGALATLVEVSLKLAPAAERACALVWDAGDLHEGARWDPFARREPTALTVVSAAVARALPLERSPQSTVAVMLLEDEAGWVAAQERFACERLGTPLARLEGAAATALAQGLADLEAHALPALTFTTAANTPAALPASTPGGFVLHAPAGRLHVFPAPAEAAGAVRTLEAAGFRWIDAAGFDPPAEGDEGVRQLRRQLAGALDPARTFAADEAWIAQR